MKISKNLIKYIFTILNNNCKANFLIWLSFLLLNIRISRILDNKKNYLNRYP